MKNLLKMGAWLSGAIGMIMMLLGIIAVIAGNYFMGHLWTSYFYPAYNFLLLGVFLFLAILVNREVKK